MAAKARAVKGGLRLSVLADNEARPGYESEWGLSLAVDCGGRTLLWDTGKSDLLLRNAARMGLNPATAQMAALSHGHYDHGNGLHHLAAAGFSGPVYAHPAALSRRYAREPDDSVRYIGLNPEAHATLGERLRPVIRQAELLPGLFFLTDIPRHPGNPTAVDGFYGDPELTVPDTLPDDGFLVWAGGENDAGLVVILGCCHSGLRNSLTCARDRLGAGREAPIRAVVGGLHLYDADAEAVEDAARVCAEYGVRELYAGHCTGRKTVIGLDALLRQGLPGGAGNGGRGSVRPLAAGDVIRFS